MSEQPDPADDEAAGNVAGPGAETAVVTDTTRRQVATIRDEGLVPLMERLGALERELGRLVAERDAQDRTIAALRRRAEVAEAPVQQRTPAERATQDAPAASGAPATSAPPTVPRCRQRGSGSGYALRSSGSNACVPPLIGFVLTRCGGV